MQILKNLIFIKLNSFQAIILAIKSVLSTKQNASVSSIGVISYFYLRHDSSISNVAFLLVERIYCPLTLVKDAGIELCVNRKNQVRMRNPFFKGNPFNEYLKEVERKEYAQKRRIFILLAGLIASILAVGFIYLTSTPTPLEEDSVPFDKLEIKAKQTLVAQRVQNHEDVMEGDFCLDSIICVIEGEFTQHKPVYFHIANYNQENTYVIEYGDGNQKRIPAKHAFVFDSPGKYQVKITAYNPVHDRRTKTTQTLLIKSNPLKPGEHIRDSHC